MALTTAQLKARREAAKRERDRFQPLLDEAYQYAIPLRKGTKDSGTGEKRVDQVFDSTAMTSAMRFAGKYQQDLWPPEQRNFALEPGPYVRDPKTRERHAAELEIVSDVLQSFFDTGDWDMAFHEMALDLVAGTGAILCNPAEDIEELWSPISVAMDEVMLEGGPDNKISGIYWDRKMTVRVLMESWPKGEFDKAIRDMKPEAEIDVHVDTVLERNSQGVKRWRTIVWSPKQPDKRIWADENRTCPWITPRYIRVPGETYGRGLAMLAMPEIKTLNTAKRIQLMAAAIAMLGIYTAVDDGVFNPDLSPLEPGAFWKVARNGGTMGPSVSRFPDPRLDMSMLVIENMQNNVRDILMDNGLPTDNAAVKSPTEILQRVQRMADDHLGAFGRQIHEVVVPAVRRTMELAYNKQLLPREIKIDHLLTKIRVKSPLAIAREAARLKNIMQWLEMVLAVCGAAQINPQKIAEIEAVLLEAATMMGVPEKFKTSSDKREKIEKEEQAMKLAAAAAGAMTGQMPGAAA